MANDLNRCEFIGRLGADPDVRYTAGGDPVVNIRIAVGSQWKDKATGQPQESTEWVPIVFFNGLAGIAAKYLTKGSRIYVSGRFRTRKWQDRDGNDRYSTEVVVDMNGSMQMLDSRSRNEPAAPSPEAGPAPGRLLVPKPGSPGVFEDFDDDIPF